LLVSITYLLLHLERYITYLIIVREINIRIVFIELFLDSKDNTKMFPVSVDNNLSTISFLNSN